MSRVFTEIKHVSVPWWKMIIPRLLGKKWRCHGFEFAVYRGVAYVLKEPREFRRKGL